MIFDLFLHLWCVFGFHAWLEGYGVIPYWDKRHWRCIVCRKLKVEP